MSAAEITETPELLDDDQRIAAWIRAFRLRRDLTLAQLSERSGVSIGHLSRLENGARTPTVRVLLALARALGVSVGALVGEEEDQSAAYVSRRLDRRTIETAATSLQSLSDPALCWLQAVELCLQPGRVGEPASHSGEEWIYVLEGAIEVSVNGTASSLGAGDVIQFRADVPHALRNPGGESATVLVLNSMQAPIAHLGY